MPKTARVAAGAVVVFIVFLALIVGGWSRDSTVTGVDDFAAVALVFPAIVFAAAAARSTRARLRLAWSVLTVGLILSAVLKAIWTYGDASYPNLADAVYLVWPVAAWAALLLFPADYRTHSPKRMVLDGFTVLASLFLVCWVTTLYPLSLSGGWVFAVSLARVISDIVTLAVAGVVVITATGAHRLSLILLAAGVAWIALANLTFVYLAANGRDAHASGVDVGWVAGLLFISVAAVAGLEAAHSQRDSRPLSRWALSWWPLTTLLVAAILAAAQPAALVKSPAVLIVSGVLVLTVISRQILSVKEKRQLWSTVAEHTVRDPLTGLANRALFNERLETAMQLVEREQHSIAIIVVDVDDFKLVNDNLGHLVGDDLLVVVARRLLRCARSDDTVARLGGDEFAVLVDGGAEAGEQVGRRIVESFEAPFMLSGHEVLMRPSLGMAVAEPAMTVEELVRRAYTALDSAKRSRARGVQIFHEEMQMLAEVNDKRRFGPAAPTDRGGVQEIQLLGNLRRAIDDRELTLVYQPKLDLRTGAIVGAEALLRWPQPDGSVVSPAEFLPLIRRHGLMGVVTELVIDTALDDASAWHRAGVDVPVAVNLFAASIASATLPALIDQALTDYGLTPSALAVEITEDLLLDDSDRTRAVLQQLQHNGIRIAIDDFGSGYSTLSYLRELPIDEVKLDRGFIAPILVDDRAAAVVRAVVDLAHVLGLTVVVEGVEDAETAACVRQLGCDIGQGFYYGRPAASADFLKLATDSPVAGQTAILTYPLRHGC